MVVNRTKITFSLDKDIAEWLALQSEKEDRNKSRIVERLLKEYKAKLEENSKNT